VEYDEKDITLLFLQKLVQGPINQFLELLDPTTRFDPAPSVSATTTTDNESRKAIAKRRLPSALPRGSVIRALQRQQGAHQRNNF
jgi:hypothetical protein